MLLLLLLLPPTLSVCGRRVYLLALAKVRAEVEVEAEQASNRRVQVENRPAAGAPSLFIFRCHRAAPMFAPLWRAYLTHTNERASKRANEPASQVERTRIRASERTHTWFCAIDHARLQLLAPLWPPNTRQRRRQRRGDDTFGRTWARFSFGAANTTFAKKCRDNFAPPPLPTNAKTTTRALAS